ncbi:MAG: TlpA family protein disulfide reductase [Kiritimatiellae bacterium]|nr:TlpA family protein disulfide reductase [Kiritimatiellia bacterium]
MLWLLLAGVLAAGPRVSAQGVDLSPDLRAVLSEIQAMGHGYHSVAEWRGVFGRLDEVAQRAEAAGNLEEVIEARLLWAMVCADMLGDYNEALNVLGGLKERYGHVPLVGIRKVYVREAEVYAKLGDEEAIRQLIREFKAGPHFDREYYPYSGGQGRDVPLAMTRPHVPHSGSLTVTAMEKSLVEARYAPGRRCPSFETTDSQGRAVRLEEYRGRVLLIDLWLSRWAPWRQELPRLLQTYNAYQPHGFEILGVCLEGRPDAARAFAAERRLPWRLVFGDLRMPGLFGVYGEAANILVDREGVIVGRNLKGSELVLAVRNALGME